MTVLSTRTLNRTLLMRHRLLERVDEPLTDVIEHLVGLQAQNPHDPYVTLWSRVADFDPAELSTMLERRKAVRATLMRTTIHLVTARDCLLLRPLMNPRIERSVSTMAWGKMLADIDTDALRAAGEAFLADAPRTTGEMRAELEPRFDADLPEALALFVKHMVPAVQAPPRGLWGQNAPPAWQRIDTFLGRPMGKPDPSRLLQRYLAAFGPATIADFRAWSGLTGYTDVVERLRPKLRTFRGEDGRELLDVPGAPIADGDAPAPVRFFPDYDNVFIGHKDRSRITDRPWFRNPTNFTASFAVGGFLAGSWKLTKRKASATLQVHPWRTLTKAERSGVEPEAEALAAFLVPEIVKRDLRFV